MENHDGEEIVKDRKLKAKKRKKRKAVYWALLILLLTFTLSFAFGIGSELVISSSEIYVSIIIVIVIIAISILFDIIGTAAASAVEEPFLAMASKKVKGAKKAVWLVKNNEKVSSICNDVIGDICGIISGAAGAAIAVDLFIAGGIMNILGGVIVSAVIASLTVGGKAIGKKVGISKSRQIIFFVAKVLSIFSKKEK